MNSAQKGYSVDAYLNFGGRGFAFYSRSPKTELLREALLHYSGKVSKEHTYYPTTSYIQPGEGIVCAAFFDVRGRDEFNREGIAYAVAVHIHDERFRNISSTDFSTFESDCVLPYVEDALVCVLAANHSTIDANIARIGVRKCILSLERAVKVVLLKKGLAERTVRGRLLETIPIENKVDGGSIPQSGSITSTIGRAHVEGAEHKDEGISANGQQQLDKAELVEQVPKLQILYNRLKRGNVPLVSKLSITNVLLILNFVAVVTLILLLLFFRGHAR
jgi:hypothetical protein